MVYRGIARGKIIELKDEVSLPEGTEVEVLVKQGEIDKTMLDGYPKGSPQALLAALKLPAKCTPEDVEALVHSMQQGRQSVRFEGIFE